MDGLLIDEKTIMGCKYMYHPIEITIPDGILYIQNNAFRKQRRLKTVIFPDSLLMIGSNALPVRA